MLSQIRVNSTGGITRLVHGLVLARDVVVDYSVSRAACARLKSRALSGDSSSAPTRGVKPALRVQFNRVCR